MVQKCAITIVKSSITIFSLFKRWVLSCVRLWRYEWSSQTVSAFFNRPKEKIEKSHIRYLISRFLYLCSLPYFICDFFLFHISYLTGRPTVMTVVPNTVRKSSDGVTLNKEFNSSDSGVMEPMPYSNDDGYI